MKAPMPRAAIGLYSSGILAGSADSSGIRFHTLLSPSNNTTNPDANLVLAILGNHNAPTGLYHPNRLLNLGSNRWSFKPQFAVSHPFGPKQKWEFDGYANAYFYTDNNSYHGTETLRQQVLPGLEGHISYSFVPSLWASLDTRYSFGGDTIVNGKNQNNAKQNFTLGSEVNVSFNPKNSLVVEFAKVLVHQNGPAFTGFAFKYLYSWGKGYR